MSGLPQRHEACALLSSYSSLRGALGDEPPASRDQHRRSDLGTSQGKYLHQSTPTVDHGPVGETSAQSLDSVAIYRFSNPHSGSPFGSSNAPHGLRTFASPSAQNWESASASTATPGQSYESKGLPLASRVSSSVPMGAHNLSPPFPPSPNALPFPRQAAPARPSQSTDLTTSNTVALGHDISSSEARGPSPETVWCDGVKLDKDDFEDRKNGGGQMHVYQCRWSIRHLPCGLHVEGDRSSMNRHLQRWHGVRVNDKDETPCLWDECGKTMQKESIARHIGSQHLNAMGMCSNCGTTLSRKDAWQRHVQGTLPCQNTNTSYVRVPAGRVVDTSAASFQPPAPINTRHVEYLPRRG
ncbi:hypothetical protein BV22DRAFT_1046012 [Leucogyrophana mollusca]|uniref:Uncharacterized protein n=1 Tax=Leucogyrophana mollusca TaxID=85980 RepID=A0ACB8BL21_9AGAM|nr:hypothetical protein BV22DRAFT_1046012 [Leucogyrophana mollusca]